MSSEPKVLGWLLLKALPITRLITHYSLLIYTMLRKKMLKARWVQSKALVIAWFLIMNILFFLPGSALSKEHWLASIHIDKWAHIGLFAILIFLFCSAFNFKLPKKLWMILAAAIVYGFLVEVVQKLWVPNRSFDMYDVLADTAGSILGLVVWLRVNKKNKPL